MSLKATRAVWQGAPNLRAPALLVLLALADSANDAGVCWPSVAGLAERVRSSERSVQRVLVELESAALIAREMVPGRKTLYRITVDVTPDSSVTPTPVSPVTETAQRGDSSVGGGVTPVARGGDSSGTRTVRTTLKHTSNRQTLPSAEPTALDIDIPATGPRIDPAANFPAFWDAYPRKVARPQALKAFVNATKRAPAHEIVEAARRLANDPNLGELQFVPYPATWLNSDRWADGPLPARRGTRPADPQADILRAEMEKARAADAAAAQRHQIGA